VRFYLAVVVVGEPEVVVVFPVRKLDPPADKVTYQWFRTEASPEQNKARGSLERLSTLPLRFKAMKAKSIQHHAYDL
jgi:hypothetical protein